MLIFDLIRQSKHTEGTNYTAKQLDTQGIEITRDGTLKKCCTLFFFANHFQKPLVNKTPWLILVFSTGK